LAPKIYLDTSAIVKRYVQEKGSDSANMIYAKCDAKELSIYFSFWNIGEALGAIDQYRQRRWITQQKHEEAVRNFAGECLRLMMLEALNTVPVNSSVLSDSWDLIERHRIYQADALQIVSCKRSQADLLLSADGLLLDAAKEENIPSVNIENFDEVKSKLPA